MEALKQKMITDGIQAVSSWMKIAECSAQEGYDYYLTQTCAGPVVLAAIRDYYNLK